VSSAYNCHDYKFIIDVTFDFLLLPHNSRDGPEKDYVQHHMERHGEQLWRLLSDQRAFLYVCGDAKSMAKDVHRALVGLVQAGKGCNGTQAEAYVKQLQDTGRYQRDVW